MKKIQEIKKNRVLVVCTTDSMIWNFLIPHIMMLQKKGYLVDCVCSKTGFYMNELRTVHGLTVYEIPFQRNPFCLTNIHCLRQLKRLLKSNGYDTVFCHEPIGGVMGRLAGKYVGARVIYMAHGFHFYRGAPVSNWILYYSAERLLSHYTDMLITINYEDYKLSQYFACLQKKYIRGIGVDTTKFSSQLTPIQREKKRGEYGIRSDSSLLLSVGELISRKNHEVILYALANLNNPSIHYMICGEGPLEKHLKDLSKKLLMDDRVHFLGFQKNISVFYEIADIFVFPSWQEGLSIALMEAMAIGLPVVCSKIRGNTDLIQPGKGGLLVQPNDTIGFTRAIDEILRDCVGFGQFNQNYVKQFDISIIKEEILKIFSQE